MSIKPDFVYTATGYRWLDRLTRPIWERWHAYQERKMFRIVGQGNEDRGRNIMKRVFNNALDGFHEVTEVPLTEWWEEPHYATPACGVTHKRTDMCGAK